MLHNNEQCHREETDGCRQSGECAAFTGLQHCGLPRSPSPLNPLPAYTAPSGNAWRTSANTLPPLTPLLPLRLPPPRQTPSDVFPPQPASLTFCSIKNRHPFPNDDFSSTIFFNSHPKHDPHTHPNHYFFFSILFRISSRYFSKNPGIFTPSRWIFQNLLRLRSSPDKSAPLIDSLAFLYRKRRKTNFCKLTFGF